MSGANDAAAPLGVVLTPRGAEAAVYSAHASALYFCLYDATGTHEIQCVRLHADGSGVHRASIDGVGPGARYGLRADGPFDPLRGARFDMSKLLADPYAVAFDRPFRLHPSTFAFGVDSGPFAPKAIALSLEPGEPGRLRAPSERTVVYEANLRGLTKLRGDVPEAARGCFAGLAHQSVIAHLGALGVTTVEIMPADAFVDERHLPPLGLANAWGYNPIVLGAPDPRLAPGGWAEVRAATDALHAAGMEAILDVVLNHNGESDEFGPTLSFRGLDNATYFRLAPGDAARYVNDTGCGNCLALDSPVVMRMALAALKRWMVFGGVDGFRFDLAVALGRRAGGFDAQAPIFSAIADDPLLSRAKLIAEPWDVGPDGYRLGAFPANWGEWNDRFRDAARRFWRGDARMRGELATRLAGSRDVFGAAPSPAKSVNYVAAHDGFALADLVSYAVKHNEANGERNRDGADENFSWNHGVEGPSDDPAVLAARARDMRNLLALPFVARGTPMLTMGSELGHSQRGNNNAYAQNNAISWIDWSKADAALIAFTGRLAKARREHPALFRQAWLTGQPFDDSGIREVEWRDAEGPLTSAEQWQAADGEILVAVLAAPAAEGVDRVAVAFNRAARAATLILPPPREGKAWRALVDTGDDSIADALLPIADRARIGARTTLILAEAEAPAGMTQLRPPDAREIDVLADAAGISADWWDVAGRRAIVSPETKLALLTALRLPAGSQAQARESLARLVDETGARRLPFALVRRFDRALSVPVRADPAAPERSIEPTVVTEDGRTIAWRAPPSEARRRLLADGRTIVEREIALPDLPIGRHRLCLDGVECAFTVAPPEAYSAKAALRRRFGLAAQLYALRRGAGDQGIGDFTTLGLAGELAGRAGAAFFGVNPLHAMFEWDRARCSPYHPSDRRFLDPIHIDVVDGAGLPRDDECDAALAREAEAIGAAAREASVDYDAVWRIKRAALRARFCAFERARVNRPGDPLYADHARFIDEGGEALRRFAIFQAIAEERRGEEWRRWPQALRDAEAGALEAKAEELVERVAFAMFAQWLADRRLAGAAARAKAAGLEIGLYRDLAVGAAPDGAESWARVRELALGVSVGAPPDPFAAEGQVWNVQPPDPVACARDGWRGSAALLRANMRHAGMLRIDHAMGLARLFVVPDGASPSEGAYLSYPLDDLLGHVALESQRSACMVVGEDLGTVPEGFRDALARADILGMRVLWFERRGADLLDPADYPALSIACAATHDLPTLAGWWLGADIAERLSLGLIGLEDAQAQLAQRASEKRTLKAALVGLDLVGEEADLAAPMSDDFAAAVHAFLAGAGSLLASAQLDDLSGERTAANLPGTDRERPNWRHRHALDVETLFSTPRAREILAALAARRG
jgi:glycogen operon protein